MLLSSRVISKPVKPGRAGLTHQQAKYLRVNMVYVSKVEAGHTGWTNIHVFNQSKQKLSIMPINHVNGLCEMSK